MNDVETFVFEIGGYWCLREMQNGKENIQQNTYKYTISVIEISLAPAGDLYCKHVVPEYSTHAPC